MRSTLKNKFISLAASLTAALLIIGSSVLPAGLQVYAASGDNAALFDNTNVLDDLENSATDGETFDITKYSFDQKKSTTVFSFVEFCYSYAADLQGDFGLYVYVHNPKGLQLDTASSRNMIQLRAGSDTSKNSQKYHLEYLNRSERTNYEGLFYKFKVNLSSAQKQEILSSVSSAKREYRVTEVELVKKGGDIEHVTVGTSYYFEGYAGGYGPNGEAKSTLEISSEQKDTLSLNVQPTQYRPNGSNGKNEYTQDSLHSVYFAVPNEFIDTYGEMAAVHATWLNAVLAPALVTGNKDAYDAILPFLGKDIGEWTDDLDYYYYGGHENNGTTLADNSVLHTYLYGFNARPKFANNTFQMRTEGKTINPLYLMYDTNGADADDYTVPSPAIHNKLEALTKQFGGELVADKYSRVLFESVDSAFTEKNITRDEQYALTQEVISQHWWDLLWGGKVTTTKFNGIQAIYAVTEEDLDGTPAEVSNRLFISESDYENFCTYFEANTKPTLTNPGGSTVYLFRYQVSDYVATKATLYTDGNYNLPKQVDSNAYFFQETVNLDFDIIDVTFSNGEVNTVIPVAMSPIDIIPNATPPLITHRDSNGPNILQIILAILLLAAIALAIYKVLEVIIVGSKRGGKR